MLKNYYVFEYDFLAIAYIILVDRDRRTENVELVDPMVCPQFATLAQN